MRYLKRILYLIHLLTLNIFGQELGELIIYNTNNSNLGYDQIHCLEFDDNNNLWVGTEDGLNIFNEFNNTWINYNNNTNWSNLLNAPIRCLEWNNDPLGLLLGTDNGIVEVVESSNNSIVFCGEYEPPCPPINGVISTLMFDNNNQLWSGTTDGLCVENMGAEGSWLIHNTNTKFYSNNITQIKQNPNNNMIAIGTMNGGLVTYSDDLFNIYYSSNSDILDNSILDVAFDNNNNVIMCTPQAGMGVLTQNGSWIWFNTINSELPTNSLKNVVVDSNNNLWITTLEDGLVQYKNNTFYTYNTENSNLPDNQINTIICDTDNNLWLGTDSSGLIKVLNSQLKTYEDSKQSALYISTNYGEQVVNIKTQTEATLSILNNTGQLIIYTPLQPGSYNINTNDYTTGLYLFVIKNNDSHQVLKLVKN